MITSNQNPKIKLVRSLFGRPKNRREAGAFVAEGVRLVEEALAANWDKAYFNKANLNKVNPPFRFVLVSLELSERGGKLVEKLVGKGVEVEEVEPEIFQSISETEISQGILAVLNDFQLPISDFPNFFLILDSIRDPGNMGTLLRTAAAAGVHAVLLPSETTDAFAPKVVRAGMGAHFRLPIQSLSWDEIRRLVNSLNLSVYLADMDGVSCWQTDFRTPLALVVGGEAEGATESARELAHATVSIPMPGKTESLNAAVAGSVLMFEIMRQRIWKIG
ncbi:RNA methyltransferase [Patescibacteria group bacterium]|nr:RNA methyltransferase [Patescibacteria group bacterium]